MHAGPNVEVIGSNYTNYYMRNYLIKYNLKCKFCGLEKYTTKSAMTSHEKHCLKNKNAVPWKGHKLSEETKKKVSEGMKKAIKEGRATGWHRRKTGSQSYPEKWMSIIIKNEFSDKDYQDELHVGKYRLDFAWPHKMRYIEIDGRQHEDIERKESDIKKDNFCKKLGWTGMRVSWSYICQNTQKAILEMKDFIDNGELSLIAWENPKEKLRKDIAARKAQHQKDNDKRKNLILNSGINFQSFGWLEKVASLLGISHTQTKKWILRNMPGFYEQSKHR